MARALRNPASAAMRADLMANLPVPVRRNPYMGNHWHNWLAAAAEGAAPAEYTRMQNLVEGDTNAAGSLLTGQPRARMREAPAEPLNAMREEWRAVFPPDAEAPAAGGEAGNAARMEALRRASTELCELARRVPPGADYVALDTLLRDFSGEGPGQAKTDSSRLDIPRAELLTCWVRDQPGPAATWLATLPLEEAAGLATGVVDRLFYRQAETLAGWVQAIPPGAVRDRTAWEAADLLSRRDAATATTVATLISEPGLRAKAMDRIPSPVEK